MTIDSLAKLFLHLLRDMYNAENQLTKALPMMVKHASHPELREALEHHLGETRGQVARLERVFGRLDRKAAGLRCEAMHGLIAESETVMKDSTDGDVRDAGLIISAQRVEHYEIASYGSLCSLARILGDEQSASILHETLEEEKAANDTLSRLAKERINADALAAGAV